MAAKWPIKDRICKQCGTVYHPVTPKVIPWAFIAAGAVFLFLAFLFLVGEFTGTTAYTANRSGFILCMMGAIAFITMGIQILRKMPRS